MATEKPYEKYQRVLAEWRKATHEVGFKDRQRATAILAKHPEVFSSVISEACADLAACSEVKMNLPKAALAEADLGWCDGLFDMMLKEIDAASAFLVTWRAAVEKAKADDQEEERD